MRYSENRFCGTGEGRAGPTVCGIELNHADDEMYEFPQIHIRDWSKKPQKQDGWR